MLYPVVGTYLNERSFGEAVARYEQTVQTLPEGERQRMLAEARAYNDSLRGDPVRDPFVQGSGYAVPDNYDEVLDVDGTGLMGTVRVPALGLALPLYHGTSDEVLARGAGHLPQTSLPVGGEGTHAVITGHTGLPTARLFTDLARLGIGDVFIVEVLGSGAPTPWTDVRVVEPDDVSAIRIDEGRELVTLLTCTPYGVNSHRLLVRGERCELPEEAAPSTAATRHGRSPSPSARPRQPSRPSRRRPCADGAGEGRAAAPLPGDAIGRQGGGCERAPLGRPPGGVGAVCGRRLGTRLRRLR